MIQDIPGSAEPHVAGIGMQLKHHPTQTQPPRFPGAFPGSIKARPSRAFPGHFSPVLLPHDLGKSGFHRSSRNPDFIPSSLLGCAALPAGAALKESGEGIPRGSWRQEWDLWGLFLRFPVGFGSIKGWIPAGIGCEVERAEAAPPKEAGKKKNCCCFYGILNKGIFFFFPDHSTEPKEFQTGKSGLSNQACTCQNPQFLKILG